MQIPLQIAFQGCEPSDLVRASIEREFERLEVHDRHITSGRVTVIGPGDHHKHGAGFQVHILLTMPPKDNIVVSHTPPDDRRHEHAEVAVKDAFAAARRQIDDLRQKS
jgi:Sigma 54 modulation protein / S30EA ribosomal protein